MTKLIFGCGYLGSRVAGLWRGAGETVHVVTRSAQRAADLVADGYQATVADVNDASSLASLPVADIVLFAVGYDRSSSHTIEEVYGQGMQNVLDALPPSTGQVVYISSTGVYGQTGDVVVDEQTPCEPTRAGGRACLAAEQTLASHSFGPRSTILRLAGIYGLGRVPYLDRLRAGDPIPVPEHGLVNLIHVDDAAAIVVAAASTPPTNTEKPSLSPELYCVSDGHPVERAEYYGEVARLLGSPAPRFVASDADLPATRRASSSKRVSNARLVEKLYSVFKIPTYREGLATILAEQ